MSSLVKHSFIKGPGSAGKAAAHVNYLQNRPGEDRNKKIITRAESEPTRESARTLHVPNEESQHPGKAANDFKTALADPDQRGKVVHKFILSPGEKDVDMNKYAQDMMSSISQHKGQDLRYAWVVHDNTEHRHAHVVVLGKDADGNNVRFDRTDHALMRAFGDRYLEREHGVEMQYSKEIEMYARTHAHNLYSASREQTLNFLKQPDQGRRQEDEDLQGILHKKRDGSHDYLHININWNEGLDGPSREGDLNLGSTWQHERGRLSEVHDLYTNSIDKHRWEDVQQNTTDQSLKDYAAQRLAELETQHQATVGALQQITGLTPEKFDDFIKDLQEGFAIENREIDMALYPEKYEPQSFENKEIDLSKVKDEDKIQLYNGDWVSKFDSTEHLDGVRLKLWDRPEEDRLEKEDFSKLCSWIGNKERGGEEYYGQPPLKEREIEPESERTIDRPLNLEDLSSSCSRDFKDLKELIAPREAENPELMEIDVLSNAHSISVEDALDARNPEDRAWEEALSTLNKDELQIDLGQAETIENSILDRDEPDHHIEQEPDYEVTYEIEYPDEIEQLQEVELDFDTADDHGLLDDTDSFTEHSDTEIDMIITELDTDQPMDQDRDDDDHSRSHEDDSRTSTLDDDF